MNKILIDNNSQKNVNSDKRIIDTNLSDIQNAFRSVISETFAENMDIASEKNNLSDLKEEILPFLKIGETQFRTNFRKGLYGKAVKKVGGKYYLNVLLFYLNS